MADDRARDTSIDKTGPKDPPAFKDMAKNVAKKVMQHIRDQEAKAASKGRRFGTAGVTYDQAEEATEFLNPAEDIREVRDLYGRIMGLKETPEEYEDRYQKATRLTDAALVAGLAFPPAYYGLKAARRGLKGLRGARKAAADTARRED